MAEETLTQDLPGNLDEAFQNTLLSGENVLISLPGATGEALVVTDRRVAIVRENASGDGADVFSHPVSAVAAADIDFSQTGGILRIKTLGPSQDDQRTLYFPVERTSAFEAAVEQIRKLISTSVGNGRRSVPYEAGTEQGTERRPLPTACPSCSAETDERDAFCSACGEKIKDTCQLCGGALPERAGFCPHCGSEARLAVLACPACSGRVNSMFMSYCPQCGTSLSAKCAACGAPITVGWPRCRYCGREIGSAQGFLGRGFRRQAQRLTEEEERRQSVAQPAADDTPSVAPEAPSPVLNPPSDPAAEHNARGAELFDAEKVEEAVREFGEAVRLAPENASYHCNLAVAYDEADQDDDARGEYERALELNPNEVTALLYLGYLLNEHDEPERAAELWRRLIEVAPGSPEAEEAQQNLQAQETL